MVDPFFPVLDLEKLGMLTGSRTVSLECEYQYKRGDGEAVTESDTRKLQLLGYNETIFSGLAPQEVTSLQEASEFIPYVLDKVRQLDRMRREKRLSFPIEIDGGIHQENLAEVVRAGQASLVAVQEDQYVPLAQRFHPQGLEPALDHGVRGVILVHRQALSVGGRRTRSLWGDAFGISPVNLLLLLNTPP